MHRAAIFDIETNAIDFEIGNDPDQVTDIWIVCVKNVDTEERRSFRDYAEAIDYLSQYEVLIGHNIINFDIPCLSKVSGKALFEDKEIVDTLVLSRLLWPDRSGGHSLAAWGETLGVNKIDFDDFSSYSNEMKKYCYQDVELNHLVYKHLQMEMLNDPNAWKEAFKLETQFAKLFHKQEYYGVCFDRVLADSLVNTFSQMINEGDARVTSDMRARLVPGREITRLFKMDGEPYLNLIKYCDQIGVPVPLIGGPFCGITWEKYDLNSVDQQKKLLLERGWKPVNTTPKGGPQIDSSILEVPIIGEWLLERNGLSNRLSKVQGLIKVLDPSGIIHAGGNTIGTPTARLRHKRVVNIPKVSVPYGKEFRSLFKARPGKIFCGYDASALELRMLAHYIGDRSYILLVLSDDKSNDAHTLARDAGIYAGGNADRTTRDTGKTINYALIYGAQDTKLGEIIGKGFAAGSKIRQFLIAKIKGFQKFLDRVNQEADKGYLYGLDGRRIYLREKRKALNTLIQGGGSIFMKTVAVYIDDMIKDFSDYNKVIDSHDESQIEIPDTPEDKERMREIVIKAFDKANKKYKMRCKQSPEIKFGYNWAETH